MSSTDYTRTTETNRIVVGALPLMCPCELCRAGVLASGVLACRKRKYRKVCEGVRPTLNEAQS